MAIPCPEELKDGLVKVQQEIKDFGRMKLVERENVHMTLKFLGEVDGGKIEKLRDGLRFLESIEKFEMSLGGVGVFPKPDYVRVVWVGVGKGCETVASVQRQIDSALKPLGFKKDAKFHPHFTIARVKFLHRKRELVEFLDLSREREFGGFAVDKIVLMNSQLTPQGPIYSPVEEFSLR